MAPQHGVCAAQDSLFYRAASPETGLVTAGADSCYVDVERFWNDFLRHAPKRRPATGKCSNLKQSPTQDRLHSVIFGMHAFHADAFCADCCFS